jgi:hypothetical protein
MRAEKVHIAPHGRHARERPAMADKRRLYSVTLAGDDPMLLQTALGEIAEEGGRVISVTWQPSRTVTRAGSTASVDSGFTIVSEH